MSGQDDATVDKARFDGLMSAHQKALAENRTLREQAQDANAGLAAEVWAPGTRLEVSDDGQVVEYSPPTPQNPNQSNYVGRGRDATAPAGDDGSPEWAKAELNRQLGYVPDRNPFGV